MHIRNFGILAVIALTAACASAPSAQLTSDPLPRIFPVQVEYAGGAAGFQSYGESVAADPFEGRLIRFRGSADESITLSARIFLAGAFVSDQAAVDRVFDGARAALGDARLIGESRERIATATQVRVGRRAQFAVDDNGTSLELSLSAYFVDPYAVVIQASYAPERTAEIAPMIHSFAQAWIATVRPDRNLLCGAPEVVLVRSGLSNVSTNGRVIFLSTETDNIDDQTIAELSRAAAQQRARVGCTPRSDDFSAVEAAMARRARTR